MKINKEDNQYYGSYFEQAIVSVVNQTEISNKTNFSFSVDEIEEMNSDAKKLVKEIFPDAQSAVHIGKNTSLKSGDIIVDGEIVEIKYVANGTGTHFNTSVNYTHEVFDYNSMSSFMRERGLYDDAKNLFGAKYLVNTENTSPMSQKDSSALRGDSSLSKAYADYKKREASLRAEYVKDFLFFLNEDPDRAMLFVSHMISKEIANKEVADRLIVFNHQSKEIINISKSDLFLRGNKNGLSLSGKYSITNGDIKATFSWQNGVGLNNPTIRVFLT